MVGESGSARKGFLPLTFLLALLAGGGGGYFAWKTLGQTDQQAHHVPGAIPSFIQMEPFIITLKGEFKTYYLQIKISLMSRTPESVEVLEAYQPLIRNEIFRYLNTLTYEFISDAQVIDKIRTAALERVNSVLIKERAASTVDDLVLTDMVIQ